MQSLHKNVLLLTVGTGTADRLKETVIDPFRKSFEKGEWSRVVLFPSKETESNAFLLKEQFSQFQIEVRALRKPRDEEDVDACFAHFDAEISRLLEQGYAPEQITVDITRGTKAMSAALLMAAMVHQVAIVRYIGATEREKNGMAKPGCEVPTDIHPERIFLRLKTRLAHEYLRAGNYRAVEQLFRGAPQITYPGHQKEEIQWLAWAAQFWGAWDRFDYKTTKELSQQHNLPSRRPAWVENFMPDEAQLELLEILSGKAAPEAKDNPKFCRALCADILANARRRLAEGHNEEVLVRLYRVWELIGQTRLFVHGIDTANVDCSNPLVAGWLARNPDMAAASRRETLQLAREKAAQLLAFLEEQQQNADGQRIANRLTALDAPGQFGPVMRNKSLLVHGFKSRTRGKEQELENALREAEDFFCEEHRNNRKWLEAARFRFLGA